MKPECGNNYTRINHKYDILNKLLEYCKTHNVSLALRGEIYGSGIQSHGTNPHAKLPLDFAAFSVYNFDTFQYENAGDMHYYTNVCNDIGVPAINRIECAVLTPELITHYAENIAELNSKPFEGVVIKHSKGSFKILNLCYDSKK